MNIPPVRVAFSEQDRREIGNRLDEILSTGMLAQGKYVSEFEQQWAAYVGCKHAVAVTSASSAIEAMMRILAVKDREVLVPDNTFAATAMGVVLAGGRIRLVDVDRATFSVGLDGVQSRCTADTAGVIVVHIGGIVTPEIGAIRRWCDERGLWLLEDCAHAHGSEWRGKRAGTFGRAGAYSFFATKVMTTAEGGMIVTDDDTLAEEARLMRNHGKPEAWVSWHIREGSNWRMSEINAIIGLAQLRRLDEFIAWREGIAGFYLRELRSMPELTAVLPQDRSSWYKFIVLLPPGVERVALKRRMRERGVALSGEVYETPLHRQPIFAGAADGEFRVADDVCQRHICLPLYHGMGTDEAKFVVDTLRESL